MLKNLLLQNFRAFKFQEFDFSTINIFVGANNSGKSSVLSALNLLAQTITYNESGSLLLLNGKYDNLGTYIDIVHGNVSRTPITISFSFGEYKIRVDFKYRLQRREIEIIRYEIEQNNEPLFYFQARKDAYEVRYRNRRIEQYFQSVAKRRPQFERLSVYDPNLRHLRMGRGVDPRLIKRRAERQLFDVDRAIFRVNRNMLRLFSGFDSLGPFRQQPQRTFLFSGEAPLDVGSHGEKAVDILVTDYFARGKSKRGIIDIVSTFFSTTFMAQGIEVKALTSRHFEICLVDHYGKSHNICDVGFGCSQVLPVLVGVINAYYRPYPMFVVQEPEIHLHPHAQAELATLFVKLFGERGQLFIETHSDTLLLRLQRHVAKGDISAEAVRVFFMEDVDGEKRVTSLNLDDRGVFDKPWPGGFFPQRQNESLELARTAAKKRKKI